MRDGAAVPRCVRPACDVVTRAVRPLQVAVRRKLQEYRVAKHRGRSYGSRRMGDLFCGTGTWGMGWEATGEWHTAWGMDLNPRKLSPLDVFKQVHPRAVPLQQDITDVRAAVTAINKQGYVHAITVSSPCQGLSSANGSRDVHDDRNRLTEQAALVIVRLDAPPDVVAWENVRGLLGSPYWAAACTIMRAAGYVVELAEVEAAWWVPQQRTRVIALATKGAASSTLVERTKAMEGKPSVTMRDAACGPGCYYAYRRQQRDRCCMPHDTPHPCLRKNSGYRPRAGTYKRRAPWQHRGRARPGDACAYEQAHKLSIDDYMVVQGWRPQVPRRAAGGRLEDGPLQSGGVAGELGGAGGGGARGQVHRVGGGRSRAGRARRGRTAGCGSGGTAWLRAPA